MKKTEAVEDLEPVEEAAPEQLTEKMSLDEFCRGLSTTEKRVELIAAFHHWMKFDKKIMKTSQQEFGQFFQAFLLMPA